MRRLIAPYTAASFAAVAVALLMAFLYAPLAQCDAGCETQRIFYFHVPSAYTMYIGIGACVLGSIGYLVTRAALWDAIAQAGAELGVTFASIVLTTGPIWGRKAWGTYWVWDPRLTTTLLATLIFVAYLVLRTGAGEAEKRFSSALAILGAAIIPIIHFSVRLWRGQHPTVITRGGGGLGSPAMGQTLAWSFTAFTLMAAALLIVRTRMALTEARIDALRTEAAAVGLAGEESS